MGKKSGAEPAFQVTLPRGPLLLETCKNPGEGKGGPTRRAALSVSWPVRSNHKRMSQGPKGELSRSMQPWEPYQGGAIPERLRGGDRPKSSVQGPNPSATRCIWLSPHRGTNRTKVPSATTALLVFPRRWLRIPRTHRLLTRPHLAVDAAKKERLSSSRSCIRKGCVWRHERATTLD